MKFEHESSLADFMPDRVAAPQVTPAQIAAVADTSLLDENCHHLPCNRPKRPEPLGLIAGAGVFPMMVATGAARQGRPVVCCGIEGAASADLKRAAWRFKWVAVSQLQSWIEFLKFHGCREVIIVGRVAKVTMHHFASLLRLAPDLRSARAWLRRLRNDRRPQAVLDALIAEMAQDGIRVMDSTQYCSDHLSGAGVLTRQQPSARQWDDMRHGFELCQMLSRNDIGQALAIKQREIIAVEALEGTDAMIERAGRLCRNGDWTLVKVANKRQDMRLDVPTIGVETIQKLRAARCTAAAIETGSTIMLEKDKITELAERYGISLVGASIDTLQSVSGRQ